MAQPDGVALIINLKDRDTLVATATAMREAGFIDDTMGVFEATSLDVSGNRAYKRDYVLTHTNEALGGRIA